MAALKTTLVLLLVAVAMMTLLVVEADVHVGACNQVCNRIDREKNTCCRAHGHRGFRSCRGGRMICF